MGLLKERVAAAIIVAALITGCSKKIDDAALATRIRSQLASDPILSGSDLQAHSAKGVVTLTGTAANDAARLEAYKLAAQTPGVVKIDDQMTVLPPTPIAPAGEPVAKPISPPPPAPRKVKEKKKSDEPVESEYPQEPVENTPAQTAQSVEPTQAPPPPPPSQLVVQTRAAPPPAQPPQPKQVEIPAGTTLVVRMIDSVDSSVNHAGEVFHAALEAPVVINDQVVVSQGADVYVRLSSASSAGRMKGKSELHMELLKLEYQGRAYPLVSSTNSTEGASKGKNTAKKVGGGAAIGAIIGGIAGGGAGAAIGAGVGAGTGAVWSGVTKGKQVKIPSETTLNFQLEQPVAITVLPRPVLASTAR